MPAAQTDEFSLTDFASPKEDEFSLSDFAAQSVSPDRVRPNPYEQMRMQALQEGGGVPMGPMGPESNEFATAGAEALQSGARAVGKGFDLARKGIIGGLADYGEQVVAHPELSPLVAGPVTDLTRPPGEPPSNIQALMRGEELPAISQRRVLPPVLGGIEAGFQELLGSAPKVAAVTGLQALGVPAPVGAGLVFGSTPEGFDAKQAAIAVALPVIGKWSGELSEVLAGRLGIAAPEAKAIINRLGGVAGASAALTAGQWNQIRQLPQDQQKAAWADAIGNIAGMAVLGAVGPGRLPLKARVEPPNLETMRRVGTPSPAVVQPPMLLADRPPEIIKPGPPFEPPAPSAPAVPAPAPTPFSTPPLRPDPTVPEEQFPPLPKAGDKLVTIRRRDGTTYRAAVSEAKWPDEIISVLGLSDGRSVHRIAIETDGKPVWSTGMIDPGETIIEDKPAEKPPEPSQPAPTETPATAIESTPISGKTLGEWEAVTDAAGLPKGANRAALAKWLAVPNQPAKILAALKNKKRTREIHAPQGEVTQAEAAATLAPVPGMTRLYHGEGAVGGAGAGGSWFTENPEYAAQFGAVTYVDVPKDVADAAQGAARKTGTGGPHFMLPDEWVKQAKPMATQPGPKTFEISETGETIPPEGATKPAEPATTEPEPATDVKALRARVRKIADRIFRIQKSIPVGGLQVPDYLKSEWDSLWAEREKLGKQIREAERPAREQAEREREERNRERIAERDKRVAEAPVYQSRNGWEIIKEGADYVLRHPQTKADVYRGKLSRVREVADESKPEVEAPAAIEPKAPAMTFESANKIVEEHERRNRELTKFLKLTASTQEKLAGEDFNLTPEEAALAAEIQKRGGEVPEDFGPPGNTYEQSQEYKRALEFLSKSKTQTPKSAAAKVETQVQKVAKTEGQRPAKEVKSELVDRLEKAIATAPNGWESNSGKITIDIPGDGVFTVLNTKEALGELLARAKRIATNAGDQIKTHTARPSKNVEDDARNAARAYGSPEKAYQSVTRQLESLPENDPETLDKARAAQALRERIYDLTDAGKAEVKLNATETLLRTYEEGAEGFREKIAKIQSLKKPSAARLNELRDLQKRYRENQERIGHYKATIAAEQVKLDEAKFKLQGGVTIPPPTPAEPSKPVEPPRPKGIAGSVRNKWTSATDEGAPPMGSESGFINLDIIRDFIDSVTPHVKNTFLAIKEIGREATHLARMTDYRRAVLNWSAKLQRSFGEAADAQKEIRARVPSPERRDGITNWIQADGDPVVLANRRAATANWVDPTTGKPHPQRKQLLAGYDAALTLTPEEIQVANDVKGAYAGLAARGQKYDVLKSFKDNYVTQIWNLLRGPQGTGSSRTLRDRFKFSRASTFPTFFDGEQSGYVPKTKDIAKLLPVYLHEMNTVIAARQLVEQLSKGVASDGRPLVAPRGVGIPIEPDDQSGGATLIMPKAVKGATNDYRTMPNQPALSDWRWATKDTAGNPVFIKADLALHPEAYSRIKSVLGKSAIREWYSTRTSAAAQIPKVIAKGLDDANSGTKRTMLGLLAPFHQVQEGTHAIGHRVNPFFSIPKVDLVRDAGQMDAARHGLMLLPDRASENQFMEGLRASGIVSRIPLIGPLADWYANYLFKEYIPGLKYKTYQAILARNQSVYGKDLAAGKVKLEDVKALSAEQANAAYGHLNYADLARNPTIQHLLQLALLAPDFLESRGRFASQAGKGATGAKVGREQLIALATLAIAQAALAYIVAKQTGGKWDASRPFEFTLGTRRYTMRSVPEDLSSLLHGARQFAHSRLSPIIGKGTLQYMTGVDWRGKKVTAAETTKELLQQPIPISIRGFTGIGNSTLSGLEQLAGSAGLKISRYNPDQAKIDAAMKIQDFADTVRSEAKKLPLRERYKFVKAQMTKEKLSVVDQTKVLRKLQQQGTFIYQ